MDQSELRQYKVLPRQSFAQRYGKLARDYWVITSLIVGILSVGLFGILSSSSSASSTGSSTVAPNTSGLVVPTSSNSDDEYWIKGFENGGHFTNFTQVIMDELSRDFNANAADRFALNVNREILDKENWKDLFNVTENVVKAMKLISLQDDVLRNKRNEFTLAENDFEACRDVLIASHSVLDTDTEEIQQANSTIAREESVLNHIRDELNQYQTQKRQQINSTTILITQMMREKQQQAEIFEQTVDKGQYLKELLSQQLSINQNIEELRSQILLIQAEKRNNEDKQIQNIELAETLVEELNSISLDIQRLELNIEMDNVVGRVKRDEHINNTKQLTALIQKRIKLINSHKIHSTEAVSDDLLRTFENDKSQLIDLNNFQINLIRSFRSQTLSQGGKTLEQLKQEQQLKQQQLEEIRADLAGKDLRAYNFELLIVAIEERIQLSIDELEIIQIKIKELQSYLDSDGEVNADQLKAKVKQLDEQIIILKQRRADQEKEYQTKLGEFGGRMQDQKDKIKQVQGQFSRQISKRQSLEKTVLTDLNKCRSYRYMMGNIQSSAEDSQLKVVIAQEQLVEMKLSLFAVLDKMIPDEDIQNLLLSGDSANAAHNE